MTHKEMRANADKLAELCRIAEIYSHEIPDSEAGHCPSALYLHDGKLFWSCAQ